MIIQPKVRGFICTTAHPDGCAAHVAEQMQYVQAHKKIQGPRNVLIIGASTGYGLASRIVAGFGAGAKTIGVFFEREASDKRTASAGWYNSAAFEKAAHNEGLYAKSINGDAFSDQIKKDTIALIKRDMPEGVDLVIYSLASPKRQHPKTGQVFTSSLKPTKAAFTSKTLDVMSGQVSQIEMLPATADEIDQTVEVMGGEDWEMWIEALLDANALAPHATTVAFSYIGPEITFPIYHNGTIGHAKAHLQAVADTLNSRLSRQCQGAAYVSVNKGLVTQASSAIPVVPLYFALLYKVMKEKKIHEGCIEQIWRLFADRLYSGKSTPVDSERRIRIDELELRHDVQEEVAKRWAQVDTTNLETLGDLEGYREDFYHLFGFRFPEVDYDTETNPMVEIPSIPPSTENAEAK